jgi:hypothetical protein
MRLRRSPKPSFVAKITRKLMKKREMRAQIGPEPDSLQISPCRRSYIKTKVKTGREDTYLVVPKDGIPQGWGIVFHVIRKI